MAFLSLLALATMTFHLGSMVVVVLGLSRPHQLEKSDPGAAPANPVGLARGQEDKKAYCQKSQVRKTVTVLERIASLGTFGDWRRLDHIVLFTATIYLSLKIIYNRMKKERTTAYAKTYAISHVTSCTFFTVYYDFTLL